MSRIGKLPINIPPNVEVHWNQSELKIEGPFGRFQTTIPSVIDIFQSETTLTISLKNPNRKIQSLHGLYRTLIDNMIIGVSEQLTKILILKGVGYRAVVQEKEIILNLGYSHPVKIQIPEDISVEISKSTTITLKSCNKEKLGLFAANIRDWRQPEPYKGKGILYENEQILRKAGKSAK